MVTEVIKTIKPGGGGDYLTAAAWIAARKGDLTVRDTVEIAEVYGGGSIGTMDIRKGDWTVDATRYIIVRAASGERHPGKYDTNKAKCGDKTGSSLSRISVPYTRVIGMQFLASAGTGGTTYCVRTGGETFPPAAAAVYFDGCIFHGADFGLKGDGDINPVFYNCAFDRQRLCCVVGYSGTCAITLYNCTGLNNYNGVTSYALQSNANDRSITEDNCYWQAFDSGVYNDVGGSGITKGANTATSNAEAVTASLDNIPADTSNFTNVGETTADIHLVAGSGLLRKAVDKSATFTKDIDDATRPPGAGNWDIGADQLSTALAGALFVLGV